MPTRLPQTCLEVRMTENRGRGVFSLREFHEGELIERAPVIHIPKEHWQHVEKSTFFDYLFSWGDFHCDETALVLGFGSIYNHSYSPCAFYKKNYTNLCVEFYALRKIELNEEITINYNCDPNCKDPLWFHVS